MTISHGFRQLANVLENFEANGLEVLDVSTADDDSSERLTVDLTVTVPTDLNESARQTTLSDDAAPANESTASQPDGSNAGVREQVLDPLAVSADATNGATAIETPGDASNTDETDGSQPRGEDGDSVDDVVDCPVDDCEATFESDHGMRIHRTKVHGDDPDGTGDETPSYRDPERLREAYAACDSFPEMREALETDVSTQTVRRQMIAHDIYEPGEPAAGSTSPDVTTDDEEAGADDGAEQATDVETGDDDGEGEVNSDEDSIAEEGPVAEEAPDAEKAPGDAELIDSEEATDDEQSALDGIELPEGVTACDLRAAVSSAQTLYHVQQRFDLDRSEAMELLEAYDLLELVHGRVSNRDLRKQVDEDEITSRILEHAPNAQPSQS